MKDESHWSDPEAQKERGSWYGAAKTEQERLVQKWVEDQKSSGAIASDFKNVAICPTMVLGPNLNPAGDVSSGTMGRLLGWFQGGRTEAPNDSMSFIHVEDCARMHTNALELPEAHGRYMCLLESLHWNDILLRMKELYPAMPDFKLYEGSDKVMPTQFNLNKMNTLGVQVRSIEDILKDSLSYFRTVGALN
jgi:nucleoside-diphosphate-sugar epimerase